MYLRVPQVSVNGPYPSYGCDNNGAMDVANPKSNIFTQSLQSNPTLAGFKSRNTTCRECKYSSASAIQYATLRRLHKCSRNVDSGGSPVAGGGPTPLMARHSSFHSSLRSVSVVINRSSMIKYPSLLICFPPPLLLPPPEDDDAGSLLLLLPLFRIWNAVEKHPSARPYNWIIFGWSKHANNAVSWAKSSAPITNLRGCARTAGLKHFNANTFGLRNPLIVFIIILLPPMPPVNPPPPWPLPV